jgi:hypothetical protein
MEINEKVANSLLDELFKAESKLNKWRTHGIGIVMSKETFKALNESNHPKKDFILQGVLVERRTKLRF